MFRDFFQKSWLYVVVAVAVAAISVGATLFLAGNRPVEMFGPQAVSEPAPGTVTQIKTWTFYPATAVTGSGTAYSSSPKRTSTGIDVSRVKDWHSADVFVTVDISGTATLTVTPQFSTDASNWTDATYDYVADTLVETTTVLTSTGVTTATSTLSSSSTVTEGTYRIVISADGTDYLRVPIAGEYMRVKLAYSGEITPTVTVTLRND
jgi:hypothetical protein